MTPFHLHRSVTIPSVGADEAGIINNWCFYGVLSGYLKVEHKPDSFCNAASQTEDSSSGSAPALGQARSPLEDRAVSARERGWAGKNLTWHLGTELQKSFI